MDSEWAVSGQDLLTGEVCYLTAHGWVSKLISARIFDDQADLISTIGAIQVRDPSVLFPAKLKVSRGADGAVQPVHFREVFRATGPSNRFHGKQAEFEQAQHV